MCLAQVHNKRSWPVLDPLLLDPGTGALIIMPSDFLSISLMYSSKKVSLNSNDDDSHRLNVSVKKSSFMDGFNRPQDLETKS